MIICEVNLLLSVAGSCTVYGYRITDISRMTPPLLLSQLGLEMGDFSEKTPDVSTVMS